MFGLRQVGWIGLVAACVSTTAFAFRDSIAGRTSADLYRSVGAATLAYANDHDGLLPLMAGANEASGSVRMMSYHRVPAGWQTSGVHGMPHRIQEDKQIWANSVLPYFPASAGKHPWKDGGLPLTQLPGVDYSKVDKKLERQPVGLTYNGLLHAWSKSAIVTPGKLPLYSGLMFGQNMDGAAVSNPGLYCSALGPCRFHPTNRPQHTDREGYYWQVVGLESRFTVWIDRKGMNFAAADGSAYWKSMEGIPSFPKTAVNVNEVPFSAMDPKDSRGKPYGLAECVQPGGRIVPKSVVYAGYYRPDSLFQWTAVECRSGL